MKKFMLILASVIAVILIFCGYKLRDNKGTDTNKEEGSTKVKIINTIDKYCEAMSSSPGIGLKAQVETKEDMKHIKYHWIAEEGTFLNWDASSSKITELKKEVANNNEIVYWSVDPNIKIPDKDFKVILKVEDAHTSKVLAEDYIVISRDEKGMYAVVKKN